MSKELLLVKACANYDPHTIKFFDDESKKVGELAMKDGVLTFTGNADESARMFVQRVCDRTFQLTSQIKELEQEKAELLAALKDLTTNPHVHLGDLVYKVRDSEGEGWDGPQVKAWSDAVQAAAAAIAKTERRDA